MGIYLWLDDLRDPREWNAKPPADWVWIKSVPEAKELIKTGDVEVASLDNDLGTEEEGRHLVLWMAEHDIWPSRACFVHSGNVVAHEYMKGMIERYGPY